MLKAKLFKGFAVLVIIFGVLSAFISLSMIKSRIMDETQRRVRLDLESAWAVYNSKLKEIETVLKLAATKNSVTTACFDKHWNDQEVKNRLELIRNALKLDFLGIVSPEGQVVLRTSPPYVTGDYRLSDPFIGKALKGESTVGTTLLSRVELEREGAEKLVDQAFLDIQSTPHARKTAKEQETRGMAMMGAVPVTKGSQVTAVLYGGVLLNRNYEIIDHIKQVVYKNEKYDQVPLGTATLFLHDVRISTTVKLPNGNRAIGTRVSKEVADAVLDNAIPWQGRAFVVKDWYLTAYDPIRDCQGQVIGMLYVGILEKPFEALGRNLIMRYVGLSLFGLLIALVLAFFLADKLTRPIYKLVEATHKMTLGEKAELISVDRSASKETQSLVKAFNEMTQALEEREASLKEANENLEKVNTSLKATNHSYMETVGFVSHELKGPIASILNYVYLIKEEKIGPLTEKQKKSIGTIDRNLSRIVEMIRHYLNLSRIENGVLQPIKSCVRVLEDVVKPLIENYEPEVAARNIRIENQVTDDVLLLADLNMTREVFENLMTNAIKYGRNGGVISLRQDLKDGFVDRKSVV